MIFLTLGTGVGSGVFVDGTLVPNTEFGQMEIRGRPAERRSASAARTRRGLSWKAWAQDLDEHLQRIEDLMWPTLFILGGGVSKNADKFIPRLTARTRSSPPSCATMPGIIGAGDRGRRGPRRRQVDLGRPAGRPAADLGLRRRRRLRGRSMGTSATVTHVYER